MTTRVVLVDDHQLLRAGIASLLRDSPDIEVVGETGDGASAAALVARLVPDVLLLDLAMPGMSGFEVLEAVRANQPTVKVIVLSMHASEEHVLRALRLGAAGYMLKDVAPDELVQAVAAVVRGESWLSDPVSRRVIAGYLARADGEGGGEPLSPRQLQVLKLIAEGASTKQIGAELNLSVKTIETYRAQIMEKLDIRDVAGLVRYAVRQGIVPL